jgi:hypothetical protein
MRTSLLTPALAALLLIGCDANGPAGLDLDSSGDAMRAQTAAAQVAPADISGLWAWSDQNFIHLDEFSTGLFGFAPEGRRTTIRCTHTGIQTVVQDGSTFTSSFDGHATCVSAGGAVVAGPARYDVRGSIVGQSIHLVLEDGPIQCPGHGAIRSEGGVAVAMAGTLGCIEPGHPLSSVQAPAPRAGPNRMRWEATRLP